MDKIGVLPAPLPALSMSFALPRTTASGLPLLPADLSARQRGTLAAVVVAAHGLVAWLLWHAASPAQALAEPPVITATLVMDSPSPMTQMAPPPRPADAPPHISRVAPPQQAPARPTPAPVRPAVLAADRPGVSREAPVAPPLMESKPAAQPAPTAPAPVAAAAPAPQQAPANPAPALDAARSASASPKELPMSAVRYLVEPPKVYPRTARDLGESGVVLLKVLIDEEGRPKEVLVSRSSGYPRLDRQAIQNMKAARFQPHIDAGVPRAVWMPAEIVFNLE